MISRKARKALRAKRKDAAAALADADPYLAGDAARHDGKPASANPHPEGSEDSADWLAGWREAVAANDIDAAIALLKEIVKKND